MRSVVELVVRWWCSASPGSASLPCFSTPSGGRQVGQVAGHQVDGLAGVGLGEHRLDRRPFGGRLVVAGQGDVPLTAASTACLLPTVVNTVGLLTPAWR
jgi:hypothetical protein